MRGENISLSFGTEIIYDNSDFQVNDGEKIGIVGVNGAGKTTLFKVILKEQPLDSGKVFIDKSKRIGYLPQEIELKEQDIDVFNYLLSGRPIKQLEQEITDLYIKVTTLESPKVQDKILKEIGKKQSLLEYYDVYHAEDILFDLVESMNIDSDLLDLKLSQLSGGQKSKVAFARLLYSNPEILLLDEPTNHLDVDTREFVINYLKNYSGLVLVISHDTSFLDAIVDHIIHIDKVIHKIKKYNGNYSTFLKKIEQEKNINDKIVSNQEREEKKLTDFILQYSNSSGKRKRIAVSREKLLEKKKKNYIDRIEVSKIVKLNIIPKREDSKIPLKVNNITFNYPGCPEIIHNLSFTIARGERFLIVGDNGVGKSTLLKLLVKQLQPIQGNIWFGNKTDIAYYAQEQEQLDLNKSILDNVEDPEFSDKQLRTILGSFLFNGDDVFKNVSILSPGERARIALAKIIIKRVNLLILDEPTNHLDPETQKIIGVNFKNYSGTIILVSHNPDFIEQIGIDRMLILPTGKITNYSREKIVEFFKNSIN